MPGGDKCYKRNQVGLGERKGQSCFRWRVKESLSKEAMFEQKPEEVREGAKQVSGERSIPPGAGGRSAGGAHPSPVLSSPRCPGALVHSV